MSYIKIDGEFYECEVLSNKTVENRHQLKLKIEGNSKTLRNLLLIEKHGSCRVDFGIYSVFSVLLMLTNITIGSGREAKTRSMIVISWTS